MKLVTAADFHFADHNPGARIDNYKEAIFEKLAQIRKVCEKVEPKALLIPGDLFHIKTPSRVSHALVRRLAYEFGTFKCQILIIPGNHDLSWGNVKSLNKQPLGVLGESKVFKVLEGGQNRVSFVEQDRRIDIVGIPFNKNLLIEELNQSRDGADILLVMAHVYASLIKSNFILGEELISYRELFDFEPDIYVFGHYHIDQGVYCEKGKTFVNLGAVSRGSAVVDNFFRIPKIGIIEISQDKKVKVKQVKLKVKDSSEIFDLEQREKIKSERKEIEKFVQELTLLKIGETKEKVIFDLVKDKGILSKIAGSGLDKVRESALKYLELAQSEIRS